MHRYNFWGPSINTNAEFTGYIEFSFLNANECHVLEG